MMEPQMFVGDGPWKFTEIKQITADQIRSGVLHCPSVSASQIADRIHDGWIEVLTQPTWIERKWRAAKACWKLIKNA